MLFSQNKTLILGALAVLGVVLIVQFLVVQDNWAAAAAKHDQAETERADWEKNFKSGEKLMPKPEAEAILAENKKQLAANLAALQRVEFGTKESLQTFSEKAAGTGDRKNYMATKRTTMVTRAKDTMQMTVPSELGLGDKASEDPVALNLLRLAFVESFFSASHKAGVPRITKIQHYAPKFIKGAPSEALAGNAESASADEEKSEPPGDRLVQFLMRVQVHAPERVFGRLLYELQKPSEGGGRGYLCLRGFSVAVRDTGSGMIEGTIACSALLNEKLVRDFNVPLKADDDPRRGVKELNIDRGY